MQSSRPCFPFRWKNLKQYCFQLVVYPCTLSCLLHLQFVCHKTFSNMMSSKSYILSDYEYVFYCFLFRRTLIDEHLGDPLDTSTNLTTNTPNPTTSDATNNHTIPFTVSSSPFLTLSMRNCRIFEHLIREIGPYPCVVPEGFDGNGNFFLLMQHLVLMLQHHQQTKALKNCSLIK